MRDQSLRGHIKNLEQQGELIRVDTETDPTENLSALGWKIYDQKGNVLVDGEALYIITGLNRGN